MRDDETLDRVKATVSVRCANCRWKFRCVPPQTWRAFCQACQSRLGPIEVRLEFIMPYHRPPDQRRPAERSYSYLDYIRDQPCCICADDVHVEAAHVRSGWAEDDRDHTGGGRKPSDVWTLPLCGRHHREQHTMNEREFWASYGLDPMKLCLKYQVKASTR